MTKGPRPTRDLIIDAAGKLFHTRGIHAVSMDGVAAKAGFTKRTIYYHFKGKDDLIAAYLGSTDEPSLAFLKQSFAETHGDVAERIHGVFRGLARLATRPRWKGCGVLRTSAELIDTPGHPALAIGRAHKKRVEDWLSEVLAEATAPSNIRYLSRQIMLLLEGSLAAVLLHRDVTYMAVAGATAAQLIRESETTMSRS